MARPPVFLMRNAKESDLKGVKRLAGILNTVNLPNDAKVLLGILKKSAESFARKIRNPLQREFTFVMENFETGEVVGTEGRIRLPIGAVPTRHGRRHEVVPREFGGRAATTDWQLLARKNGLSRVLITLTSARTHQLRIHFAAMGHPIVGDQPRRVDTEVPLSALVDAYAPLVADAGAAPALKKAIDSTDQRDINSSCMIAMAKIGADHADFTRVTGVTDVLAGDLTVTGGHLLIRIAVRHDDEHRLGLAGRDQVVHDHAGAAHVVPGIFIATGAVQEVEHGVARGAGFITGGRVDEHAARVRGGQ